MQHYLTGKGASQGHTTTKPDLRASHLLPLHQGQAHRGSTVTLGADAQLEASWMPLGALTSTVVLQHSGEKSI